MAQVVLSDIAPHAEVQPANLFQGLRFFISQKVPQRSRFVNDVRFNGGEVLPIEKHADIKIVDHARKESLPGTYSYRYIENSVRNGILEDLKDHRVGPAEGTVRSIGSTIQPPKGTRNKYTQDDDHILWNWVQEKPQKGGGTDGNEIYKQLEAKHPQHPWQSWRDRWIKHLKGKPRPFPLPYNAPPTPPSDVPVAHSAPSAAEQSEQLLKPAPRLKSPVKRAATTHSEKAAAVSSMPGPKASRAGTGDDQAFESFDEEDAEALMVNGASILEVLPANVTDAWEAWARDCPTEQGIRTARDWQTFWEQHVRPRYLKRMAKRRTKVTEELPTASRIQISTPSRKIMIATQALSSPLTEKGSNADMGKRSPSDHPESPSMQLLSPSLYLEETGKASIEYAGIPDDLQENESLAVQKVSPIDQNSKRKQLFAEEEIPSSSPPGRAPSPKRRRPNESEPIREVASTPDMTPVRSGKKPESPIYIGSENDEGDMSDFDDEIQVYESPLGKQASDTLSEPGRTTNNAQAVFRDAFQEVDFDESLPDGDWDDRDPFLREPTQQVDFEVPPPNNGWDDEDSGAEASSESESTATEIYDPRPVIQETQAILRGPTPAVDLDIPDPEGGWDVVIPSSPPPLPSSPHAAEDDISDVDAQTEAWINSQVARGISVDHVITIWKATSMDTGLAEDVLKLVRKNGEMPKDRRGVWTETDDEDLGATDARKIQRLESKHGRDLLTARWEFLNFYKSA